MPNLRETLPEIYTYDELPEDAKKIIDSYGDTEPDCETCAEIVNQLRAAGYDADYYLDAIPFIYK